MAPYLFIFWLIAGCFVINRIRFIREAGLTKKTILILFIIKIAAGCTLGLVNHLFFDNKTDYDDYNQLGIAEYHTLFSNPGLFFTDLFRSNYAEYGAFFGSAGSYWNDLRNNIIFKVLGIMNIFSGGNYYINSLFLNFISFFGHIALYRVFITFYPRQKLPVIIGCFLLPSLLYFSSGLQKDLVIFTALALFCYSLFSLLEKGRSAKRVFFLIGSFLALLMIRNFVALIVLPWALAWYISSRYRISASKVFAATAVLLVVVILTLHYAAPANDPLSVIVSRQQAFLILDDASTEFRMDTLTAGIKSFTVAAPSAIRHALLSPYPGEFKTAFIPVFAIEMMLYWLLFMLLWAFPFSSGISKQPFIWFGLTFSLSVLLFIGYITPAAGALIRYRSIYLPFLLTPILAGIDWRKIFRARDKVQKIQ